jgi:hypothetical protein
MMLLRHVSVTCVSNKGGEVREMCDPPHLVGTRHQLVPRTSCHAHPPACWKQTYQLIMANIAWSNFTLLQSANQQRC